MLRRGTDTDTIVLATTERELAAAARAAAEPATRPLFALARPVR